MIVQLIRHGTSRSPRIRRFVWGGLYDLLARKVPKPEWTFMNYG